MVLMKFDIVSYNEEYNIYIYMIMPIKTYSLHGIYCILLYQFINITRGITYFFVSAFDRFITYIIRI